MNIGLYKHYKGPWYVALGIGKNSSNSGVDEPMVVYFSLNRRNLRLRDVEEFTEEVKWPDGQTRPRFQGVASWIVETVKNLKKSDATSPGKTA